MDLGGVMIEHGNKIIEALTQDSRITAVLARNQDDLTLENLETNFDVVVLYQHNALNQTSLISRDRILDVINFAESGHMIVAVHHGIYDPNRDNPDPHYNIIPLTDYMGGYLWDVSTSRKPPLLDGVEDNILVVVNSTHYLTEGISNFTIANDEVYYAMVTSPNITAVINNRDYGPFVWSQGKYAVYIQIGHFPTDFDHPMVRRILQNAVLHIPMTG
jgi:type 1 glutamine amidotransferase